jgi:SAM-dependent methyltransferase
MVSLRRKPPSLPVPPLEMRKLVGRAEPEAFDPPESGRVFPTIPGRGQYDLVFDFGCGCGRVARQLALSGSAPKRYVGIDLHAGMVAWAAENLAPRLSGFEFIHHNVYNPGFNPDPALPRHAAFPIRDRSVSLLLALSVFTHLVQEQAEHYLSEAARTLRADGVMIASFFLFDRRYFPMLQDFQSAIYINAYDPTNAVIFDRAWLLAALRDRGLGISAARPPQIRGFHWELEITHGDGLAELPVDDAPFGSVPPPLCFVQPDTVR